MRLTILYDNKARYGLKADHGFSCLVSYQGINILFDTGRIPEILENNSKVLGVDLKDIDFCFISHRHGDHEGAVNLLKNTRIIYPGDYRNDIKNIKVLLFSEPIPEQSLLIEDARVLITGCAHPGIQKIARKAFELCGKLNLIIGGFHLRNLDVKKLEEIATNLRELTRKIVPCHCTGEQAIVIFKKVFYEDCIEGYAGLKLEI